MKYLALSMFLISALLARENPFFPSESLNNLPLTSSSIDTYPPLERAAITLPDQARVLQKVTVTYKTLDGSIESKSITLDNAVDWHIPLFISQSYSEHQRDASSSDASSEPTLETLSYKFVSIDFFKSRIDIKTQDSLINRFMMVEPHRIVLDFKRDANFLSYKKTLNNAPFQEVRIGNHDGYYRVVITLDGRYRFHKEQTASGYSLSIY